MLRTTSLNYQNADSAASQDCDWVGHNQSDDPTEREDVSPNHRIFAGTIKFSDQ